MKTARNQQVQLSRVILELGVMNLRDTRDFHATTRKQIKGHCDLKLRWRLHSIAKLVVRWFD